MIGFWPKCGTACHEICQHSDNIPRSGNQVCHISIRQHFADYGLVCKDLKQLRDECKVMGLQVWEENDSLRWKWGGEVLEILCIDTC